MISRYAPLVLVALVVLWIDPALAQGEPPHGRQLIEDWMEIVRSASRLLIIGMGALGIVLAAVSLTRAYNAPDERSRTRHLLAALFSGVIVIVGVVIGVVSRLLIPG